MLLSEIMKEASESYLQSETPEQDSLTTTLGGHSKRDLEQWLKSPFWKAVGLITQEQIHRNVEDLMRGDISVRSNADEGLLYRSDEALRGGIVAMTNLLNEMPTVLIQELEIANEMARVNKHEKQEE
jgi:hypothetical protein